MSDDKDEWRSRWEHRGPPWRGPRRWPPPAGWGPRRHRPERLFLRFAAIFGLLTLLILGVFGLLIFLVVRLAGGDSQIAAVLWLSTCGLLIFLPLLAGWIGRRAFRRIATPLADLMAAADAVAAGDLRVRVPASGRDEFGSLTASFNHMVEELELADQRRRNLTADVAHELRTPLQIIQGNLEGVLDGVYAPTPEHIGATLEETRLLARLVEDLRVLSQAEAGQLPLTLELVGVAELLADVATSYSGQAQAKCITLRVEPAAADLTITADFGRLDQVLGNLVANALRYTPAGGAITLVAARAPDSVRIQVADTGAGIAPADLSYVFDRFWRGERGRVHADSAGSGLGLAIARQLVQAQGGRIAVESELGRGTTFTVELPSAIDRSGPAAP